jgi:hypothetical protein
MTTETNEETNGTPKKRGRKAKDAQVPTTEVVSQADSQEASATDDATADTVPAEGASQPSFADTIADAQANDTSLWEWDEAEEVVPVRLTPADKGRMLDENAEDQAKKDAVDTKIEGLKDQIKTLKAEADVILARTEERNRACGVGVEQRRGTYKIGTCFALNTVRYVDRETGQVMHERAIEAHERQQSLKLVPEAAPGNVVQLHFGDVEPTDATETTDPEALLAAAQQGEAVEESDEPSDADLDDEGTED